MSIIVIDVLDAWGMLLSRSWSATLGGFLNMYLTHAHIRMGDGTFAILYSQCVAKSHLADLNGPNYYDECDMGPHIIEYDPQDLPFSQEDCIDTLLPKTEKYKEKLVEYQGKDPGSIKILKKDEEREKAIKNMVKEGPPIQPYIDDIPYVKFDEVILALMWDKRKGKLKYDKKS
jgi:hypothetical protein